jgi:hypothetical protein
VTCFIGTVVVTVSTLIQMTTGLSARSEKYGSTKKCDNYRLVDTQLCVLYDEECALLTKRL